MFAKCISWIFGLFFDLLAGLWNVSGKLLKLAALSVLCGAVLATVTEIFLGASFDAWYAFKCGTGLGVLVFGIRLLINEVAVPLVHAQEQRGRAERRRVLDAEIAQARALSHREAVSNRLKHLN